MAPNGSMLSLPSRRSALLSLTAAGLLILAFPDFELWFHAWVALIPLMWAIEREKESVIRSFLLGWLFGTAFFYGTCWWLTYALINYGSIPWPLAHSLILTASIGAGIFPGIFAAAMSNLLCRFGLRGFLAAPFVWVFSEFLRYWLTGNNWNAIGYSQALVSTYDSYASLASMSAVEMASLGGVALVGFMVLVINSILTMNLISVNLGNIYLSSALFLSLVLVWIVFLVVNLPESGQRLPVAKVIATQPNVPMKGVDLSKLKQLRQRQFDLAEAEINRLRTTNNELPTTVILPESPMNFMYNDDREFQQFVREFTTRNNVSLIFNSAEPDASNGKYFNSAMLIAPDGKPVAQYDKIYLLPFGEAVPVPFESFVPAFVGNFSSGSEYDLLPVGEAKAGVMICFESHFGQMSREYVRNGADVLIEMTNDGYLGPTPVLRQHLANAVFRAVETNRPVLRVTNVGITAYITETGVVIDPAESYTEDTRVWTVSKSDGSQTFYVRYGDWFAWLCVFTTLGLFVFGIHRRREN